MENAVKSYKPVVLVVLDGFGVNIQNAESTWQHAKMPAFREMEKFFPFTTLQASGIAVGLFWGQEGNSEVGHLTIGAGKALYHHLPRIITSIHNGEFYQNPAFMEAADFVKKTGGALHLMGLFSSGSVHAYVDHLYALLDFAQQKNVSRVFLHLFTDGRDAPIKEGALFLRQLEERLKMKYSFAQIATVAGRFYAMDRDNEWSRVEKIYKCLVGGSAITFSSAADYLESSYKNEITDEFIEPACLQGNVGRITSGDAVIFYNFREDSVRELTAAFVAENFDGFLRNKIQNLFFVTMTEYDKKFPAAIAFPPLDIAWPLAKIISEAGLKQLHVAETEKYAHVTYFFNGGQENAFPGEDRKLIPSPRSASFDETPEMSADEITEAVMQNLQAYDFIIANFANGDMVGHTGNFNATVKAIEVLDGAVGMIMKKILEMDGALIVTADHGNAEEKIYASSGEKRTKHTANPVPFFVIAKDLKLANQRTKEEINSRYSEIKGVLTDIAPTILALLNIKKPDDMTGVNLMEKVLK